MGIKKIRKFKHLPFEAGRVYKTKMATGEHFSISSIKVDKNGKQVSVIGVYVDQPHLGDCPLSIERLCPDQEFDCDVEVCDNPKCGRPIH